FNAPLLRLPALRLRRLRALDLVTYVGLLPTLRLRWPFDPAVVAPAVVDIVASLRASRRHVAAACLGLRLVGMFAGVLLGALVGLLTPIVFVLLFLTRIGRCGKTQRQHDAQYQRPHGLLRGKCHVGPPWAARQQTVGPDPT